MATSLKLTSGPVSGAIRAVAGLALIPAFLFASGCSEDARHPAAVHKHAENDVSNRVPDDASTSARRNDDTANEAEDLSVGNSISDASESEIAQFGMINLATAKIMPVGGASASGLVRFSPSEDSSKMIVNVDVSGLEAGMHGFHIHENGECAPPDASSAGGHLNPYGKKHGGPDAAEHHLGDLGNINADKGGRVSIELAFDGLAFSGPASILQKAVVIHTGPDDLATDPAGNAGERIGCGVIRMEKEIIADPKARNNEEAPAR